MKPDWKDAPEWANWLAMGADGSWYWHELEPSCPGATWNSLCTGKRKLAHHPGDDWRETKEKRP